MGSSRLLASGPAGHSSAPTLVPDEHRPAGAEPIRQRHRRRYFALLAQGAIMIRICKWSRFHISRAGYLSGAALAGRRQLVAAASLTNANLRRRRRQECKQGRAVGAGGSISIIEAGRVWPKWAQVFVPPAASISTPAEQSNRSGAPAAAGSRPQRGRHHLLCLRPARAASSHLSPLSHLPTSSPSAFRPDADLIASTSLHQPQPAASASGPNSNPPTSRNL